MINNHEKLLKWTLFAATAIVCLSLGHRALWDPDEGRYAEMAREVLVLNDWLTPHLNYLLYFEKPMLYIWLVAISFKIFGVSEPSAHLVSMLSALGGIALVGWMAGKLWGRRAGIIASLVLITSLEYFYLACAVDINMPLTFFITAAFVLFWLGQSEKRSVYIFLSWAAMALAVLTKGPIGIILPLGAMCVYILLSRQFSIIRASKPISGFLIFLAITLPWFILVSLKNPDFFSFFFVNQNIQRYAISDEHNKPIYYFIVVILAGALPWTLMLPSAVQEIRKRPIPREMLYLLVWFFLILLFFTPSRSKLATYVLPCFPALALMMGYVFRTDRVMKKWPLTIAGLVWMCVGIALMLFPTLVSTGTVHISSAGGETIAQIGLAAGMIIIAGTLAGVWVGRRYDMAAGFAMLGMTLMITAVSFAPLWDSYRSTRNLVQDLPAEARLCAYGRYYQSSGFYTGKQVALTDSEGGELDFGIKRNTVKGYVLTFDELVERLETDKNTYCLTSMQRFDVLHERIPHLSVVRRSKDLCLVKVSDR
jgi:4-amino-4-deoxy-L-arabinose transferase-like glycosyltransferase